LHNLLIVVCERKAVAWKSIFRISKEKSSRALVLLLSTRRSADSDNWHLQFSFALKGNDAKLQSAGL